MYRTNIPLQRNRILPPAFWRLHLVNASPAENGSLRGIAQSPDGPSLSPLAILEAEKSNCQFLGAKQPCARESDGDQQCNEHRKPSAPEPPHGVTVSLQMMDLRGSFHKSGNHLRRVAAI